MLRVVGLEASRRDVMYRVTIVCDRIDHRALLGFRSYETFHVKHVGEFMDICSTWRSFLGITEIRVLEVVEV